MTNLPAYTNFPELFEGARWIWSYNLVFDNVVVARKTGPLTGAAEQGASIPAASTPIRS